MTTEEKLKEEEKKKEESDRIAQQEVVEQINADSFVNVNEKVLDEENEPIVTDVDSTLKKDVEAKEPNSLSKLEEVEEQNVKMDEQTQFEAYDDESEYIMKVSNEKFQNFLAAEKAEVSESIEAMKKAHPNDYDAYVDSLRNTDYYKKCLAKWQKYYADKKQEFENEAKQEAEVINLEAKNAAANFASEQANLQANKSTQNKQQKAVEQKQMAPVQAQNQSFESEVTNYTVNTSKLKLDPDLYDSVEQFLLHDLRDAFVEYNDFYLNERRKINETSHSKIANAMRDITDTRLQLLQSLLGSFETTFDTTRGKRVWKPYPSTVEKMQKNSASRQGNMDMSTVGDVLMDSLYHYEDGKSSGILPELAKHLTLKVQEELISRGKLGNYNLYDKDVEFTISDVVRKYRTLSKISLSNGNDFVVNELLDELKELNSQFTKDVKNGSNEVSKEKVDEFINAVEYVDYLSNDSNVEIINVLSEEAENLKTIIEAANVVDQKSILKMLDQQKKKLDSSYDYNYRINKSSYQYFDKNSGKKLSFRPLIDKLLMDLTQKVGSESSKGKLKEFAISNEYKQKEIQKVVSFVESDKKLSLNITEDLLTDVLLEKHDLRERFKKSSSKKSRIAQEEAQNEIDLVSEFLDSENKDITKYINEKIDQSLKDSTGKQRKKHHLVEEKTL